MSSTELQQVPAPHAAIPRDSVTLQDRTMTMLWREAKGLAVGGMFKDVTQAEQAFAKMLIGHHLGLTPAQSMTGIDIVKGSPQLRGTLLGFLVRSREGYDWKVVEMSSEKVSIEFFRDGESQGISTWTEEDSKRAQLLKDDSNHAKYPMAMFWNRAMSQGVKLLVPETMSGIPVYTPEDLEGVAAPGAIDGEPGAVAEISPAVNAATIELAVKAHLSSEHEERALTVIREMERLAPGSWSGLRVEMEFGGMTAYAVSAKLGSLEREAEALREAAHEEAAEAAREAAAPETNAAAATEAEPVESGDLVDGEPTRPPEHEAILVRIADLEDALSEGDGLSEQHRSDIEAELDSLRGSLPPEVSPGHGELAV